jgi:hypothetical protein
MNAHPLERPFSNGPTGEMGGMGAFLVNFTNPTQYPPLSLDNGTTGQRMADFEAKAYF